MVLALLSLSQLEALGDDTRVNQIWLFSSVYLALFFGLLSLNLPFGPYNSPSLSQRVISKLENNGYSIRELFQALLTRINPLWVVGLLLLQFSLLSQWLSFKGEAYEWLQYILLGILFPALVSGLLVVERFWMKARLVVNWLQSDLAAWGSYQLISFILDSKAYLTLTIALGCWVFILVLQGLLPLSDKENRPDKLIYILAGFLVFAVAWIVCIRLALKSVIYEKGAETEFENLLTKPNNPIWAFLLVAGLVLTNLLVVKGYKVKRRTWLEWVAHAGALGLFLSAGLRVPPLYNGVTAHHWSAIIGPANMIRQGGQPLWDVPEQYGLLNTGLIAALPFDNVFQSFYLLNAFLLALTAYAIFVVLRLIQPGILNYIFAVTVALTAVFMIPGEPRDINGLNVTPAVGAFRFFCTYGLVLIILWEARQTDPYRAKTYRTIFGVGSLVWLISIFWSAESAIYCTAIWFPGYILMVFQRGFRLDTTWLKRLRFIGSWLLLPVGLFVVTFFTISLSYLVLLKHLPDWTMFYEYATAFGGGLFALPIVMNGAVWIIVLMLVAITTAGAYWFLRDGFFSAPLRVCLALFGLLWSTSSYFINRSADINIVNLTPLAALAGAILLYLFSKETQLAYWQSLIRLSLIPLFVVILYLPVVTLALSPQQLSTIIAGYEANVAPLITPATDARLLELMNSAKVQLDDPILVQGETFSFSLSGSDKTYQITPRLWAPFAPNALLIPLSKERLQIYLDRYVAQTGSKGGWLIEPLSPKTQAVINGLNPYVYGLITTKFIATKKFENSDWRFEWFVLKPNS